MLKPSLFAGILFCMGTFCSPSVAEEETLRVFTLVNAHCGEMAELLHELSDGDLTMAADRRTNSLVMMGSEETLGAIESLLLKLDQMEDHEHYLAEEEREDHEHDGEHEDHEHGEDRREWEEEEEERRHHEVREHRNVDRGEWDERELEEMEARELEEREQEEREMEELENREMEEREMVERRERELMKQSIEQQLDFLKRRIDMAAAEAKLEQAEMEAKINATSKQAEAIKLRMELANSRNAAGDGTRGELAMLEAESVAVQHEIKIQKLRLEFHEKHVGPMRQMEFRMEMGKKSRELELLH